MRQVRLHRRDSGAGRSKEDETDLVGDKGQTRRRAVASPISARVRCLGDCIAARDSNRRYRSPVRGGRRCDKKSDDHTSEEMPSLHTIHPRTSLGVRGDEPAQAPPCTSPISSPRGRSMPAARTNSSSGSRCRPAPLCKRRPSTARGHRPPARRGAGGGPDNPQLVDPLQHSGRPFLDLAGGWLSDPFVREAQIETGDRYAVGGSSVPPAPPVVFRGRRHFYRVGPGRRASRRTRVRRERSARPLAGSRAGDRPRRSSPDARS